MSKRNELIISKFNKLDNWQIQNSKDFSIFEKYSEKQMNKLLKYLEFDITLNIPHVPFSDSC